MATSIPSRGEVFVVAHIQEYLGNGIVTFMQWLSCLGIVWVVVLLICVRLADSIGCLCVICALFCAVSLWAQPVHKALGCLRVACGWLTST